jgi:hypothetical protein
VSIVNEALLGAFAVMQSLVLGSKSMQRQVTSPVYAASRWSEPSCRGGLG